MKVSQTTNMLLARVSVVSGIRFLLVGCGPTSQPPASGRVVLAQAGAFSFNGDTLELRHKDNPKQWPSVRYRRRQLRN